MAWYWIVLIIYGACGIALVIANWKDGTPWRPLELWLTGVLGPAIVVAGLISLAGGR